MHQATPRPSPRPLRARARWTGYRSSRSLGWLLAVSLVGCGGAQRSEPKVSDPDDTSATGASTAAPGARPAQATSQQIPVAPDDPVWGDPNAPVTIVQFSDFECGFCAMAEPTLEALRARYGASRLRIVYKHLPLPRHTNALPAAMVSHAVWLELGDAAFFRFARRLFEIQSQLSSDALVFAAAEAGLDPRRLQALISAGELERKVGRDTAQAEALGIRATPSFLVNGVLIEGAASDERFNQIIEAELREGAELSQQGAAPGTIYAARVAANFQPPAPRGAREAREPEAPDTEVWKVDLGDSPALGPKDALVTIVEFADFQCGFCRRVAPTLARLRAEHPNEVRVVFKHYPLPNHERAEPAATLAIEAKRQRGNDGFWQVHDRLMEGDGELDDASLLRVAADAKLNVAAVRLALSRKSHQERILVDKDQAADLRVSGTPQFFINGRRLGGARPFEEFDALVREELKKAQEAVASGVPRAEYYQRRMQTARGLPALELLQVAPPSAEHASRGPAKAPVTIQMFMDLQCPFCARVQSTLGRIDKKYPGQLRWVWRDLPLDSHRQAPAAAAAAREVLEQRGAQAFFRYTDQLFQAQRDPQFGRELFEQLAVEAKVDVQRFNQALDRGAHGAFIQADVKAAKDAGIVSTPNFAINGYVIRGAQGYNQFRRVIDRALEDARRGRAASVE
ncbi:MAG: thioredoxin domain-containing protein [Polyangiaceae bacterium]|nr:thioredoxin domain-containing protein [Polyangiaceae bacterium]MCW5792544.1 thioredoxin domain-containing protein [Polyangiaceae bacterium]